MADALGLSPVEKTLAEDTEHILLNHAGKTVLVVGHTNTVPGVIQLLGDNGDHGIDDDEFDNMFVATVLGEGKVRVTRLKYGDRT